MSLLGDAPRITQGIDNKLTRVSVKQATSRPDRDSTAVMHRASRVGVDLASIGRD
nr:hypothetical protein JVH1_8843 [Rhodococcus sp. JVH1]